MIKLKNGTQIYYDEDFEKFFRDIIKTIINESKKSAHLKKETNTDSTTTEREFFVQEIMENCMYVTHQLLKIYKDNEKLTQFIITGFIFNSVILIALPQEEMSTPNNEHKREDTVH